MGGMAVKDLGAVRIKKDEYKAITDVFMSEFSNQFDLMQSQMSEEFEFVKAYAEKPDYGDLDFITTVNKNLFVDFINKSDKIEVIGSSGDSFAVKVKIGDSYSNICQLDYIHSNSDDFDFKTKYYAFNDLGNLIGRVAKAASLKFGFDGLSKDIYFNRSFDEMVVPVMTMEPEVRNDEFNPYNKGNIILTKDFDVALALLGFDVEQYNKGFNTIEEIFEFVTNSKYFMKFYYNSELRNHKARARDKKRTVYSIFLKYIEDKEDKQSFDSNFMETVKEVFPNYTVEFKEYKAKLLLVDKVQKALSVNRTTPMIVDIFKLNKEVHKEFMKINEMAVKVIRNTDLKEKAEYLNLDELDLHIKEYLHTLSF